MKGKHVLFFSTHEFLIYLVSELESFNLQSANFVNKCYQLFLKILFLTHNGMYFLNNEEISTVNARFGYLLVRGG